MIDVVVQFNDTTANIDLPCSDVYLESQYMELHMPEDAERILFVKNVYFPESLSMLENMFIKMDELNYLAKRLCSFDKQELKQFEAVVRHNDMQEMKDLINLTFNLHKFTLIQDISNIEDVGRTYMLNMHGGLSIDEMDNYDFAAIGKELLLSEKGRITEYGILFDNEEMTFDEVYDGQVFPEYYARGTLFFEIARIASVKRPSYLLLENVPGLLSHDGGRTFATILGTLSDLVQMSI